RRQLLQALAASPLAASAAARPERDRDRIKNENAHPGTTDWQLTYTRVDPKTRFRCPWIEGFASRASVRPAEAIDLFVSTDPPSPFVIDLYRLGYYQGKGGRHMTRLGPFPGRVQPTPPVGKERLRECEWERCTRFEVPRDWVSGVYLGKLTPQKHRYQ